MNKLDQCLQTCLLEILDFKIQHGDYELLKIFVKTYGRKITVKKISSSPYFNVASPEKMFYERMLGFLNSDLQKNLSKYVNAYIEFYKQAHPEWYREVINIHEDKIIERIKYYADKCPYPEMRFDRESFCLVTCLWINRGNKEIQEFFDGASCHMEISEPQFHSNKPGPCMEWCKEILGDISFEDFIKQCRELLAENLEVPEKELEENLQSTMIVETGFPQVYLDNHSDSCFWINSPESENIFSYRPDVKQIISDYYEAQIINKSYEYLLLLTVVKSTGKDYKANRSDIELYREHLEEEGLLGNAEEFAEDVFNPVKDEYSIRMMINMDFVGHLLSYTTEQLYQYQLDELMEKDKKSDVKSSSKGTQGNAAELADLQAKYNKLAEENRKLTTENTSLKHNLNLANEHHEQSEAESKKNQAEYEKTIKDLKENIKEKDFDLNYDIYRRAPKFAVDYDFSTLKEQLDDYKARLEKDKEVIDILLPDPKKENPPEKPDISELDMAEVYDKNIVFLGDLTRMGAQELPQYFIKSHFFEKDSPYISQYENGDYVVLMIKGLTHGMFYAARSNCYLNNKPWIYYDGKSFSNLKKTIYYGITDAAKKAASENPVTAEESD